MNVEEATDPLVLLGDVPMWDEQERVLFRRRARKNRGYPVTRQTRETWYPVLVESLQIRSEADVKRIRAVVTERLLEQKRLPVPKNCAPREK